MLNSKEVELIVGNGKNATGVASDYRDHTDPKYVGPGTWNVIHRQAYKAQTEEEEVRFKLSMEDICHGFPCTVCRGHCTEYIQNHPIADWFGKTVEVDDKGTKVVKRLGVFIWSCMFHNAVNARIHKPVMNWETCYGIYSSDSCSQVCHGIDFESENQTDHKSEVNDDKSEVKAQQLRALSVPTFLSPVQVVTPAPAPVLRPVVNNNGFKLIR